jgi:pyruvate formate lyase activating enzyme
MHHETDCWLEITTLLIPGQNDSPAEIRELAAWVARNWGRTCRCISRPSIPTGR